MRPARALVAPQPFNTRGLWCLPASPPRCPPPPAGAFEPRVFALTRARSRSSRPPLLRRAMAGFEGGRSGALALRHPKAGRLWRPARPSACGFPRMLPPSWPFPYQHWPRSGSGMSACPCPGPTRRGLFGARCPPALLFAARARRPLMTPNTSFLPTHLVYFRPRSRAPRASGRLTVGFSSQGISRPQPRPLPMPRRDPEARLSASAGATAVRALLAQPGSGHSPRPRLRRNASKQPFAWPLLLKGPLCRPRITPAVGASRAPGPLTGAAAWARPAAGRPRGARRAAVLGLPSAPAPTRRFAPGFFSLPAPAARATLCTPCTLAHDALKGRRPRAPSHCCTLQQGPAAARPKRPPLPRPRWTGPRARRWQLCARARASRARRRAAQPKTFEEKTQPQLDSRAPRLEDSACAGAAPFQPPGSGSPST
jgi:hypothetical protein